MTDKTEALDAASTVLLKLVQRAADGIDGAIQFGQAQIPDVVYQLLVWNAVTSALAQIAIIITIVIYFTGLIKGFKWSRAAGKRNDPDEEVYALVWACWLVIGGVISLFLFFAFWFQFDWLQIWLAPKLYLIQYAAHLLTK